MLFKVYKCICSVIWIAITFSSCSDSVSNKSKRLEESNSQYAQSIEKGIKSLSNKKGKERDSIYQLYIKIPAYKILFIDKIVDLKYLPVVDYIGRVIITESDSGCYIPEDTYNYLMTLNIGADNLVAKAICINSRGGYIPEYEEVVNNYIGKFGFTGQKGDAIIKDGKQDRIPLDFNLAFAKLMIEPSNHTALDILGRTIMQHPEYSSDKKEQALYHYKYPQFVFKTDYVAYLKANYPVSKYIPNYEYELTAAQLNSIYKENEVTADQKLKGKRIAVTGKITSIAKNAFDEPYILLDAGELLSDVHCSISESDAMQLHKHQKVTVIGNCQGMTMQSVFLDKCVIE